MAQKFARAGIRKCLPREHLYEPRAHIGRNGVPPKGAGLIGEGQRCDLLTNEAKLP